MNHTNILHHHTFPRLISQFFFLFFLNQGNQTSRFMQLCMKKETYFDLFLHSCFFFFFPFLFFVVVFLSGFEQMQTRAKGAFMAWKPWVEVNRGCSCSGTSTHTWHVSRTPGSDQPLLSHRSRISWQCYILWYTGVPEVYVIVPDKDIRS